MKVKKYLIFGLMLAIFASFVTSLAQDDVDLLGYWPLDGSGVRQEDAKTNDRPKFSMGYNGNDQQEAGLVSYSTYSIGYNAADSSLTSNDSSQIKTEFNGSKEITLMFFADWTDNNADQMIWSYYDFDGNIDHGYKVEWRTDLATNPIHFNNHIGGGEVSVLEHNMHGYKGIHVAITRNGTHYNLFINGSMITNVTYSVPALGGIKLQRLAIGETARIGIDQPFNGNMDEVTFFNRSLTQAEIIDYYQNGFVTPFSSPVFEVPSPADATINNTYTNVIWNISCATGTINLSWNGTQVGNGSEASPYSFELNNSLVPNEGNYLINATCDKWVNDNTQTWTYDTTRPIITVHTNSSFALDNSTIIYNTTQFNISFCLSEDHDLDSVEALIYQDNLSGKVVWNFTNTTLSGTSFCFSNTTNIGSFDDDNYYFYIGSSDSHNPLVTGYGVSMDEDLYYVDKPNKNTLYFNTREGNDVGVWCDDALDLQAIRLKDKYEFEGTFPKDKDKKVCYIEANQYVKYKPNSPFKGHFIIGNPLQTTGNYVDFEQEGEVEVELKHKLFSGKAYYKITIYNDAEKVKMHSIGGLNFNNVTYQFNKSSLSVNATKLLPSVGLVNDDLVGYCNATEGLSNDFNYVWNWYNSTGLYSSGSTSSASNNNEYNIVNLLNHTNTKVGDSWIFSCAANVTDYTTTFLNSSSVNIIDLGLDNCSINNVSILNMSIFDEDLPGNFLLSNFSGVFTISTLDDNIQKNFTLNLNNVSNFQICVNPNTTFKLEAFMKYSGNGKIEERYYLNNLTLNHSNPGNVFLYNFGSSAGLSELKAVVSRLFNPIENIIVKLQRYYVGENVWRTVQIDKTDAAGVALLWVYQNEKDYRLIFQEAGIEVDRTTSIKFVCDLSSSCEQTFPITTLDDVDKFADFRNNLTYNNVSGIIVYSWADNNGLVSGGRLLVQRKTPSVSDTLCDTSVTSSSGSILCNISGYTGTITVKAYRSASPLAAFRSFIIQIGERALGSIVGLKEGLFWSGMITIAAASIGVANPFLGILATVLATLFNMWFTLGNIFTISFTIGVCGLGILVGSMIRRNP